MFDHDDQEEGGTRAQSISGGGAPTTGTGKGMAQPGLVDEPTTGPLPVCFFPFSQEAY